MLSEEKNNVLKPNYYVSRKHLHINESVMIYKHDFVFYENSFAHVASHMIIMF